MLLSLHLSKLTKTNFDLSKLLQTGSYLLETILSSKLQSMNFPNRTVRIEIQKCIKKC